MAPKNEKGRGASAPGDGGPDERPAREAAPPARENGGPAIDYQPESGQPGPREPPEDAERDEDDDL